MADEKGDISKVDERIHRLNKQKAEHIELWKSMIAADGGKIFPMDLYVQGVLNRSNYLLAGFLSLIQANNYHCAASLVRLHLDNAVRLSAAWLVSEPHKFASDVMAGKSIRTLRDSTGEKMNDAYLVRKLSKEFPWVQNVFLRDMWLYPSLGETHFPELTGVLWRR